MQFLAGPSPVGDVPTPEEVSPEEQHLARATLLLERGEPEWGDV